MRVVSHKKLKDFYETKGCEDSRVALERWYDIAEKAEWRNLSDIKADFLSTDYVGNQHYVFNIRGNNYRLVVVVKFTVPLALAMLLRPKYFPLWYVVQLVKGISVLAILLSLISLIGCKYGVIVENDDIMNVVRLWPEGRGVCLVLLCAGLLLSVGSICAARPVQRVGEYFGIAKK